MRHLMIMRHCATAWSSPCGTDHGRPLTPDGREAARSMGRAMVSAGWSPDCVVASSAARTRTTAELVTEVGGQEIDLQIEDALYGATVAEALSVIAEQSADALCVLIVGHEPCCSELTNHLIEGEKVRFPTGGIACVEIEATEWQAIDGKSAKLLWFASPDQMKSSMSAKGTSGLEKSGR